MRPAILSTSEETLTASGKSPMMWVSAVRKRLPKLWPLSPRPAAKAVLKQPREQRRILAQGHHAVADIAGRQHIELAPQAAGTAAIVGHRDDRGDIQAGERTRSGRA